MAIQEQTLVLLTVITITKDDVGLERTLKSLAAQRMKPFQFILVNGGHEIVLERTYGEEDTVITEPDRGLYDAMNKGIAACRGSHMLFLNAGDELTDELSTQTIADHLAANRITNFALEVGDTRGRRWRLPATAPKHQGMVFPYDRDPIIYNASMKVYADGHYIAEMRRRYPEQFVDLVAVRFYLGGISSNPSLRLVVTAFREAGVQEALKKLFLWLSSCLVGHEITRTAIYSYRRYERLR